jgi:Na+/proline symporter
MAPSPVPGEEPRRAARAPASFRPRSTLVLIYFFGLFFCFALVLVVPDLVAAYRELPPEGPARDDLELASRIAREAIRGRLGLALAASALATSVGAWTGALPGLRR